MKQFLEVLSLAADGIKSFFGLDFNKISYSNHRLATITGLVLLIIIVVKITRNFFGNKNSQKQSGHEIKNYYKRGLIIQFLNFLPKLFFSLAVSGILLVLAEPFLDIVREEKKVTESRVRVDLRDSSSSMESLFPGSQKSKAQVAAEAHSKFLKMRNNKNDRTSLWLFASYPHMIEDFIIDDELYFNQVEDAPWISWSGDAGEWFKNNPNYRIPKERFITIKGDGGGTNIVLALQAIIKQFDNDGPSFNELRKSILIISDAEVDQFPLTELQELQKRKIIPMVLLIRSSVDPLPSYYEDDGGVSSMSIAQGSNANVPEFAERIREYGGQYFDIIDENSLKQAFEAVDALEKVKIETTKKVFKINLFQLFLLVTVFLTFITILTLLLFEPFGTYP